MVQVLSNLCKKCDGKCCKEFEIFLTRDDLNKLKKFKGKFKIKKEGSAFAMHHSKKCYFLSKNGCILNENQKPLDCRLFPLAFIVKNKKLEFYLTKECPFLKDLPKKWIKNTKLIAQRCIKNWSEKEKNSYNNLIKKYILKDSFKI